MCVRPCGMAPNGPRRPLPRLLPDADAPRWLRSRAGDPNALGPPARQRGTLSCGRLRCLVFQYVIDGVELPRLLDRCPVFAGADPHFLHREVLPVSLRLRLREPEALAPVVIAQENLRHPPP